MSASTSGDFEQSISTLGELPSLPEGETVVDKSFAELLGWLDDDGSGRWLIILDDFGFVRQPLDGVRARRLLQSIPDGRRVSTILTLRENRVDAELLRAASITRVHPFSDGEAVSYLKLRLAGQSHAGDLIHLAKELGGIPLALTEAAAFIEESGMALREYLELLRLEKAKEADTTLAIGGNNAVDLTMPNGGQPFDALELTRRIAIRQRAETGSLTARSTDPSRTVKDSGYGSNESGSIVQEGIQEQKEASDLQSIRTLSSFVDLGLDGRLRGINIFASDLAQSLSPDIQEIVEGRELVVFAVQDALRAYSYSLEQQNRPSKLSDERKAAHFIRQQSQ